MAVFFQFPQKLIAQEKWEVKSFANPESISDYVIFMISAGGCPEAPVAEGEPTGLVPWGAGARAVSSTRLNHIKSDAFANPQILFRNYDRKPN